MQKKYIHKDIIPLHTPPDPTAPLTRPTNRSPDNPNVLVLGPFYKVRRDIAHAPLDDYHQHGYESRKEFAESLTALVHDWHGRKGECIEERLYRNRWGEYDEKTRMLHLNFHDAPGNTPEDAWLPCYLCDPIPIPVKLRPHKKSARKRFEEELTRRMWEKHIVDHHRRE